MDIIVTGRHLEITEPLREYASQRLGKIERYYDRVSKTEVILGKQEPSRYDVEIIVHVDHHEHFVAEDTGEDLYRCIDMATDKAARQVHDHKEKIRDHKG